MENNSFDNNINFTRNTLLSIENLSENENLNYFVKRYKFNFNKYSQTKIFFYTEWENYYEKIDNIEEIIKEDELNILEANLLKNFVNTLYEKKIYRKDFKKIGTMNLDFSFFNETHNNMSNAILKSTL